MTPIKSFMEAVNSIDGVVPKPARRYSVALGVLITIVSIAIYVKIAWTEEFDGLLFALISMFMFCSVVLMKVGVEKHGNESSDSRRRRSNSADSGIDNDDRSEGRKDR